jgi:hypothetical protein
MTRQLTWSKIKGPTSHCISLNNGVKAYQNSETTVGPCNYHFQSIDLDRGPQESLLLTLHKRQLDQYHCSTNVHNFGSLIVSVCPSSLLILNAHDDLNKGHPWIEEVELWVLYLWILKYYSTKKVMQWSKVNDNKKVTSIQKILSSECYPFGTRGQVPGFWVRFWVVWNTRLPTHPT